MRVYPALLVTLYYLVETLIKSDAIAQKISGLRGDYFNGPNFEKKILSRTDPQVNFRWDGQSPAPGVQQEYFSVRWTGKLYAPASGVYRFSALVDDGIRVWVGGKKVIDEWRKQDDSKFVGEITLKARQFYDLKVEYYNDWKGSAIQLYWDSPADRIGLPANRPNARLVIPARYLSAPASKPAPKRTVSPNPKPISKPVTLAGQFPKKAVPVVLPTRKPVDKSPEPAQKPGAAEPVAIGKPGTTVTLKQVQFAQGSYALSAESAGELDLWVRTLKANPALRIDIGGHTDNVGDPRLNAILSEYRAKVVAGYLTRQGIAEDRIAAKGYGGSRPVADNTVVTERIKNRRVEISVR